MKFHLDEETRGYVLRMSPESDTEMAWMMRMHWNISRRITRSTLECDPKLPVRLSIRMSKKKDGKIMDERVP